MKEEFAQRVRKQSPEASDYIIDESPYSAPPEFKKKRKKKKRNKVAHDLEIFAQASANSLDIQKAEPEYCSRSEEICAELLRRFVPHFYVKPGVTFQVPIAKDDKGNTLAVDFMVEGILFEYHPVRFFKNKRRCGDFRDPDEYKTYTKVFQSLNQDKRDFFHDVMRDRLAVNYFQKRRAVLDKNPSYRKTELVVATSPEEFYHRVITRFGKNYPKDAATFVRLFEQLQYSLP